MLLGHDVVADRESKPRTLSGRLSGEEGLKELVLDLGWNAHAVVACANFDGIAEVSRTHLQARLELGVISLLLALRGGIKTIAKQVEADAGDVLRDEFDGGEVAGVIPLKR